MATVAELIELLKGGKITKEEMLERVSTPVYTQSSLNEKTLTGNRYSGVETVPDLTQISAYPDHAPDTEAEYDPQVFLHEIEDFYPRRPPSMTTKDYSDSSSSNFLNRQVQWEVRRSVEQERLKEQRTKVENKHCTFQPVTNKNNLNTQEDPFERLSKLRENHKLRRMREEQEKLKEEAELRGCTFKPEINNYKNEVQPRYMITNEERNLSPRLRLMLKDQYTFIPRVKGLIKGMNSAKEYIKQNPFERLSKPKEVSEPDEPEEEIEISPKHSIVSSSTEYKEYGDSFSSRPFFERQALYELMKAEKKSYHENMPSVGPEICERSKKMVKKGFFERNQEMIDKKEATLKNSQKPSGCTFQPRITQKAKLVKNRSFTEMSYGDSKKKETKIQTMKQEIEQNFKAMNNLGLSHTKLYSNVGSTIKILDDPDSYVARLRDLQRNKEQKIKAIKDEREKQELSACTHAPVTIEAPSYVKQIARNMALLKAERAAYEEESKPDWR